MGEFDRARVDADALRAAANGYDAVAQTVDTIVRTALNRPVFDGAVAGRMHVAQGNAVRDALDDIIGAMRRWATSADDIAHVLRGSADRYGFADEYAASRVGG
ncbi:type VII secretion target [Mycolicibacterium goodii]|uniref:ESX-1 secretion-associated protein n=1 Tax=Mycolicibacterium goodii TaxID=134601 RepID=A0ABS6HIS0_MYCGD|nr:type VII secretion target [Mycolicibacterium goodii]MBU8821815.1 ESX-1 secretion-associated protein [Mycolicibacterium goodii]MBU8836807.1 ESX-1 secretion-associated protein [Mycolicibacterium goodii]